VTNFERADFKTMRKMVNSRLKGKVKTLKPQKQPGGYSRTLC